MGSRCNLSRARVFASFLNSLRVRRHFSLAIHGSTIFSTIFNYSLETSESWSASIEYIVRPARLSNVARVALDEHCSEKSSRHHRSILSDFSPACEKPFALGESRKLSGDWTLIRSNIAPRCEKLVD
jgi:hypothetical protein